MVELFREKVIIDKPPKNGRLSKEGEIALAKSQIDLADKVGLTINKAALSPPNKLMKATFDTIID